MKRGMARLLVVGIMTLQIAGCTAVRPKEVNSYVEIGNASYYGSQWHGRTTANGEKMDIYAMTAAHKSLPFQSKVRVTMLSTGKSVIVRINDRGPFVEGRIIDLSDEAARRIGLIDKGVAKVRVEELR